MTGIERNLAGKISQLLAFFPVVLLVGARQTGKTTLAKKCCPDWRYFDLENGRDYDYITRDYDFFFQENHQHIIIDEAQELPQLFKVLRGVVDSDRQTKGRFLLTGSSSPALLENVADSLAGRVGILEVGTLKMNERHSRAFPDVYQLFDQAYDRDQAYTLLSAIPPNDLDVIDRFLKGGYPEPVLHADDAFQPLWMENYYQTYIQRDVKKLFPKLDSVKYRRFIDILASLSGTIINKASVGRSVDVSEVTIRDYLQIADATFLWRNIPSYEKSKIKSVTKMPKGIFRDTGLIHYLLNIQSRDALLRHSTVGANFESFVIEEILKALETKNIGKWDYYYYRTRNGAEVDLVLEGAFGLIPIEIKFGTHTTLKQLTSIRKFVADNELPFGLVINNGDAVMKLCPEIIQVPARYL